MTAGLARASMANLRRFLSESRAARVVAALHCRMPSEAAIRLTRKISEAARLMQIQMLDHVIMGAPANGRPGYFSFKEGGVLA